MAKWEIQTVLWHNNKLADILLLNHFQNESKFVDLEFDHILRKLFLIILLLVHNFH